MAERNFRIYTGVVFSTSDFLHQKRKISGMKPPDNHRKHKLLAVVFCILARMWSSMCVAPPRKNASRLSKKRPMAGRGYRLRMRGPSRGIPGGAAVPAQGRYVFGAG